MNGMTKRTLGAAIVALAWALSGCGTTGGPCDSDADCSGEELCVNGTCARSPGGGPCEPGKVCRAAAGPCDVEEICPASGVCPADAVEDVGTVCRAPLGQCDLEERCTGDSSQCPEDRLSPATTVCRGAAGGCDVEEYCSGASPHCPPDTLAPAGKECRPAKGICDVAETCNGTQSSCPTDALKPAGTECRESGGDCDVAESCTGNSSACPSDLKVDPGVECRAPVNNCDVAEVCDGTTDDCPVDAFAPPNHPCADPVCVEGTFAPQRVCVGGEATCASVSTVSCNGYQCDASGANCRTTCASHSDCLPSHFCQTGGQCAPKKLDGQPCSGSAFGFECQTGVCTGSYPDGDGDGFGAGAVGFFCGSTAPAGRSLTQNDCCDSENRAFPGNTAFHTTASACGGFDFNCDGQSSRQYTQGGACNTTGGCGFGSMSCDETTGWSSNTVPACGATASYVTACNSVTACNQSTCGGCMTCAATTLSRTQGCR